VNSLLVWLILRDAEEINCSYDVVANAVKQCVADGCPMQECEPLAVTKASKDEQPEAEEFADDEKEW
jgi:hypothetical protein